MTWHNEFTETVQADWVDSVYTIAYSKPRVEAISYWHFNGKGHDGFVYQGRKAERKLSPPAGFIR
jgi:hypothetical protein